jgi:dihydroorotate dehydrogenase (NAD+) catalytic subunit
MINSIGLPNRGLAGYLSQDLPLLAQLPVPLITNVMGSTREQVAELVSALAERDEIAAIELNVSCPNVKTGLVMGCDPGETFALVEHIRPLTNKPVIVKLTPNASDVGAVGSAAADGGADALSLINTLRGLAFDPHSGEPWLGGRTGGVSGPTVKTIALAQVDQVAQRVDIPIIGMGGVRTGKDALDLIHAGATLVGVGTENFRNARAGAVVADQLASLLPACSLSG